jgi:hypothetical protein
MTSLLYCKGKICVTLNTNSSLFNIPNNQPPLTTINNNLFSHKTGEIMPSNYVEKL